MSAQRCVASWFACALLVIVPGVLAQTTPPTPPPAPGRTLPVRPPPERRAHDDPARWEKWWACNKDDFLLPRGILAPNVLGDAYTGSMGPPLEQEVRSAVIPLLLEALQDTDHQVRAAAALSLARAGDWRELKTLLAALDDRERGVVEAAILGLGLLREGSVEHFLKLRLNDTTRAARERALAAIALGYSGGDTARGALFDQLGSGSDPQGRSRVSLIESARFLGAALWAGADKPEPIADRAPLAASQIQKALGSVRDRMTLGIGVAALSKTRDPGSLQFVLAALADNRTDVRAGAAIAAGRVIKADDRASVLALIAAANAESDVAPKRLMMISLGRIGGPDARKRLVHELDANLRQDRAFAALGLGIAGATDLAPRLRREFEAANDDSHKGAIAIALGLMKDPEAFKLVASVASSKGNPELLRHLMWFFALDRSRGSREVVESVLAEARIADVHDAGAIALGLIGEVDAQNALIRLMTGGSSVTLRGAAAIGLGRMGDRRGVEPLIKLIRQKQEPQSVRARAVTGLGILCQREPYPPFARTSIDLNYDVAHEALDQISQEL